MTENELDKVLTAPLPEIPDDGFSQRVLLRAMEERTRRERNTTVAIAGAGVLLCALMPFTRFGQAVDSLAIRFGHRLTDAANNAIDLSSISSLSMTIAFTAGALTLALLLVQSFPVRR